MTKLVIFLAIAVILLASAITTQNTFALSKFEKQVNKFIRAETSGGSKLSDLCTVTLQIKDKENVSKTFRDICEQQPPEDNQTEVPPVDNQTEVPPVNDTEIPPQTTCGVNEVWNAEDGVCECKEGFNEDSTEACVPIPPQQTCDAGEFFNATSEMCEQLPTTEPDNQTETPVNTTERVKIIGVGDVECSGDGLKVLNQIKKENPTLVLNLGDLCYDSSTGNYLSTWGSLGNLLACQIGNHDAEEDGSAQLYKDFLAYCGNDYTIKRGSVLVVGLNTNDNSAGMKLQAQNSVAKLSNTTYMNGVDTVIFASHKPICLAPPNSDHPVSESAGVKTAFCEPLKNAVGGQSQIIFLSGHNHVMSFGQKDGITYIQSGAGGRSHYECGTDATFTFCNNTKYGFWELVVDTDGTKKSQFKDFNGGVVN